jgi:hypothetical protein
MIIYQEPAEYVTWFKLLFLIPAALIVAAIFLAFVKELEPSLFLALDGIIFVGFFYLLLPRRYQIYQDRLRIVLGGPFKIDIPFSSIKQINRISGVNRFLYSGVRFATSPKYVIEIKRSKGLDYIFSPSNGQFFQEQLELATRNSKSATYPTN